MAVKSWKDHKNKLTYPLYVQPKLDGIRLLAYYKNGTVELLTRRLHDIVGFEKIKQELQLRFQTSGLTEIVIDGELYSHGMNLQTISGIVRNESISELEKEQLKYYIFDCFDVNQPKLGFKNRFDMLTKFFGSQSSMIILNQTIQVQDDNQANDYYQKVINDAYEGVIYKSSNKPYEFDFNKEKRSSWYLKRKKQDDAEYPIVGYLEGKGKDLGCIVFVLQAPNGKQFRSVPNGTYDYRKRLYLQAKTTFDQSFKDKLAKIVFDDLSKDGVPLRGRIVQIGRDLSFD